MEILDIDNTAVRENQIERLRQVRASRDEAACGAALEALGEAAASGEGNLLDLAIQATRKRASVGEISDALEKVYSRHRAVIRSLSGVYGASYAADEGFQRIRKDVEAFAAQEGRRPRMLVVKLSGRCSKSPRKRPVRRSRTMFTWSASPARRPATRPWCRNWSRRFARRVPRTSSSFAAA
jgi:hypothetical protein